MMTFGRKFLMSVIAGAGSAIGAFVAKECLAMAKNPIKQANAKKEKEKEKNENKTANLKKDEES